jgi:hypothetical protein
MEISKEKWKHNIYRYYIFQIMASILNFMNGLLVPYPAGNVFMTSGIRLDNNYFNERDIRSDI